MATKADRAFARMIDRVFGELDRRLPNGSSVRYFKGRQGTYTVTASIAVGRDGAGKVPGEVFVEDEGKDLGETMLDVVNRASAEYKRRTQ